MDKGRAFWLAGSEAIAKVDPTVTVSISPEDNNAATLCVFAKIEVSSRMKDEGSKAEESKGRKDKYEERALVEQKRAWTLKRNLPTHWERTLPWKRNNVPEITNLKNETGRTLSTQTRDQPPTPFAHKRRN